MNKINKLLVGLVLICLCTSVLCAQKGAPVHMGNKQPKLEKKSWLWERKFLEPLDFSKHSWFILHIQASAPAKVRLNFHQEGWSYVDLNLSEGEQYVSIPFSSICEESLTSDWDRITGIRIELLHESTVNKVKLTVLEFNVQNEAFYPPDKICLIKENGGLKYAYPLEAIVYKAEATSDEKRAAGILAGHLSDISGVKIPIKPFAKRDKNTNAILVGRAAVDVGVIKEKDLLWCGLEGFIIQGEESRLGIAGKTPTGTIYGVYGFLEQQGMRLFAPNCIRVPNKKPLLIQSGFRREKPFFEIRHPYTKASHPLRYQLVGDPMAVVDAKLFPGRKWIDHTFWYLVPRHKYFESHPEYYSHDSAGKSFIDKKTPPCCVNICFSNPDVRKIAVKQVLEWIEKQPERNIFFLSQGEHTSFCRCEQCMAMVPGGNDSDRMITFVNHIATEVGKKYPEKIFVVTAYQATALPPRKVDVAPNVRVLFSAIPPRTKCNVHPFSCSENAEVNHYLKGWLNRGPHHIGTYEYKTHRGLGPYLETMILKIKEYARLNMCGIFYCGEPRHLRDLFRYVNSKLLWNPYQDVDELIEKFCREYYGPAGVLLNEYVSLERKQVHVPGFHAGLNDKEGKEFFTPEFSKQTLQILAKAEEVVKNNKIYLQRVRAVKEHIENNIKRVWGSLDTRTFVVNEPEKRDNIRKSVDNSKIILEQGMYKTLEDIRQLWYAERGTVKATVSRNQEIYYSPGIEANKDAVVKMQHIGLRRKLPSVFDLSQSEWLTVHITAQETMTLRLRLSESGGLPMFQTNLSLVRGEQIVNLKINDFYGYPYKGKKPDWSRIGYMGFYYWRSSQEPEDSNIGWTVHKVYTSSKPSPILHGTYIFLNDQHKAPIKWVLYPNNACPLEIQAAQLVRNYLKRISGREIPVGPVREDTTGMNAIVVGRAAVNTGLINQEDLPWCGSDGFVINTIGSSVGISGQNPQATLYGAYSFLERIGVKFFAKDCIHIPKQTPVRIPGIWSRFSLFHRERPFFQLRKPYTSADHPMRFQQIGDPTKLVDAKLYPRLWIDHTSGFLVPIWKYYDSHPEYFALMENGERIPKDTMANQVTLCTSNSKVREIAAETTLDWISKQPERQFFSINEGDVSKELWCTCRKCRSRDVPGHGYTDRLLEFVNSIAHKVKEKYPDKILLTHAYWTTWQAPTRVKPASNVWVLFANYIPLVRCNVHTLDCPMNNEANFILKNWLNIAPKQIGIYEYNFGARTMLVPTLETMICKLKNYARMGIRGVWYCGMPVHLGNLFKYINSKLLWDPFQDADKLISDFCKEYYGPAVPEMIEFINLERKQVHASGFHARLNDTEGEGKAFFTPEFCERATELLREADELAKADEKSQNRVRKERIHFLRAMLTTWKWIDDGLSFKERKWIASYLQELVTLGGGNEEWLWKVAHLRIKTKPWRKDPVIERLLKEPLKTLLKESLSAKEIQEKIPGGWRLPPDTFSGGKTIGYYGYRCPRRRATWVYGRNTCYHTLVGSLFLKETELSCRKVQMEIEAQDHDKNPKSTRIRIKVNNRVIFDGPNGFVKNGWSKQRFTIPLGTFKQGENIIKIENMELSDRLDAWWFMVTEVKMLTEK